MAVARTTAIVGFAASSNVEAARRYDLVAAGTMAHSYRGLPTEAEGSEPSRRTSPIAPRSSSTPTTRWRACVRPCE
jgi:hypothetical protein